MLDLIALVLALALVSVSSVVMWLAAHWLDPWGLS